MFDRLDVEAPRGVELTSTNDRRSSLSVWKHGSGLSTAWSVVVTGLMVFVFSRPFSGSRAVAWFFREFEDLRRQWHRGDAQSPFRTWKLSPVAAMVLRSEGRGRVARCRITRQGGVGLGSTGSTPPSFLLFFLFFSPNTLRNKTKNT